MPDCCHNTCATSASIIGPNGLHRMVYDKEMMPEKLLTSLVLKAQENTQMYGRRPYGVGCLVMGYYNGSVALHQFMPNATAMPHHAIAIGSRSQSARTYLERHLDAIKVSGRDEGIRHGLKALLSGIEQTDAKSVCIAVVTKDGVEMLEDEKVEPFIAQVQDQMLVE